MSRIRCACFVVIGFLSVSIADVLGQQTSPINIAQGDLQLQPLVQPVFTYAGAQVNVRNPGGAHASLQIQDFSVAQTMMLGATQYNLKQIHFHANSEHKLLGNQFDMEMHMVHEKDGDPTKLLVVGRWIDQTNDYTGNLGLHLELDKVFSAAVVNQLHPTNPPHPVIPIPVILGGDGLPNGAVEWAKIPGTPTNPPGPVAVAGFNPNLLLPANMQSYRYNGSLTAFGDKGTPVDWLIFDERMPMDTNQYNRFRGLLTNLGLPNGNAMPIENIANPLVFKVQSDVPEPSSMLLLFSALGVPAIRRRRR